MPRSRKTASEVNDGGRRAEILIAAARLFHERGYAGTTARDLGREVGISSGSVFHHFATKEDVLLNVVEHGLQEATARMDAAGQGLTPRRQITEMIRAHISALLDGSPAATSVLFYEYWSLSEDSRVRLIELRDGYESLWDQALEQLGGKFTQEPHRRMTRLLLFGAMNWTVQWYHSGGDYDLDALVSALDSRFIK